MSGLNCQVANALLFYEKYFLCLRRNVHSPGGAFFFCFQNLQIKNDFTESFFTILFMIGRSAVLTLFMKICVPFAWNVHFPPYLFYKTKLAMLSWVSVFKLCSKIFVIRKVSNMHVRTIYSFKRLATDLKIWRKKILRWNHIGEKKTLL